MQRVIDEACHDGFGGRRGKDADLERVLQKALASIGEAKSADEAHLAMRRGFDSALDLGFTGGLVFVGLLASVEGREIVGALLERDSDGSGETVTTPSGLTYVDARVGGGVAAKKGDFVGVHLLIEDLVTGAVYLDTKANKKPVAFIFQKKPLLTPVCEGLEEAVASMRRGGVRDATVPARLAYGAAGAALANGAVVPPNRDLKMRISIEDISPSYL